MNLDISKDDLVLNSCFPLFFSMPTSTACSRLSLVMLWRLYFYLNMDPLALTKCLSDLSSILRDYANKLLRYYSSWKLKELK